MRSIPNVLTAFRLFGTPVCGWMILTDRLTPALWLFLAAGLSDALDGLLARRYGWSSELGAYLDALADKVLVAGVYATLAVTARLPPWLVIVVVMRDVLIVVGALFLHVRRDRIEPSWLSKTNTALQVVLAALVLLLGSLGRPTWPTLEPLAWAVVGTTVLSYLGYLREWFRRVRAGRAADRLSAP